MAMCIAGFIITLSKTFYIKKNVTLFASKINTITQIIAAITSFIEIETLSFRSKDMKYIQSLKV